MVDSIWQFFKSCCLYKWFRLVQFQEVDVQLRHRPQPPPLPSQHSQQMSRNLSASLTSASSGYDAQTAMRVRRWIESRSATNVVDCRPVLNAEIQRGVALKKTNSVNDRSAPRFWRNDAMTSRQAAFFKWFQMSYLGPVQNGETCWSNTSATIKFSSYSYFR